MSIKLKKTMLIIVFTSISLYANQHKTLEYVLMSNKEKLGEVTQTYKIKDKNLFVITHSKLKWGSGKNLLDIEESSIEVYKDLKKLVQSEAYTVDYDEKTLYKTSFTQKRDEYDVMVYEKKEINASVVSMFKHYREHLSHNNIPKISLTMNELANTKVSLNDFDTTENIFAFYLKHYDFKKDMRMLSFEELTIDAVKVSDLGRAELNIGDKVILTHRYKLNIKDKKPTYIWIADENKPLPYLVRLKGSDESGDFELLLNTKG